MRLRVGARSRPRRASRAWCMHFILVAPWFTAGPVHLQHHTHRPSHYLARQAHSKVQSSCERSQTTPPASSSQLRVPRPIDGISGVMYRSALTRISKPDGAFENSTGSLHSRHRGQRIRSTWLASHMRRKKHDTSRRQRIRDTGFNRHSHNHRCQRAQLWNPTDDKRTHSSPDLPTFDSSTWNCCSSHVRFLGLSLTGASQTTVGDVVVILRFPGNREDSPRLLSQRDCSHGDLQRWESTQLDGGPIILVKEA
jgi:hypothetical protein